MVEDLDRVVRRLWSWMSRVRTPSFAPCSHAVEELFAHDLVVLYRVKRDLLHREPTILGAARDVHLEHHREPIAVRERAVDLAAVDLGRLGPLRALCETCGETLDLRGEPGRCAGFYADDVVGVERFDRFV